MFFSLPSLRPSPLFSLSSLMQRSPNLREWERHRKGIWRAVLELGIATESALTHATMRQQTSTVENEALGQKQADMTCLYGSAHLALCVLGVLVI